MKRLLKKIKKFNANSNGFSLLEAMISLAVFSIGILGVAAMQTSSVNSNTLAEDVQLNTVTAMAQIEELMATDFQDQRFLADGISTPHLSPDGKYTIRVTPRDDQAIPGAMRVVVISEFTPVGGETQRITLTIFKPDIDRVTP
jgi:prepilin-type N-terminal cleavage/methylation domain-containing protein